MVGLNMKILLVVLLASLIALSGCTAQQPSKANLKTECCSQCRGGASKDVRGMDITGEPCSHYKDSDLYKKNILTAECAAYFEETKLRVGDC